MLRNIKKLLEQGENQKVEFKEALLEFPKSTYETICAFLNTDGGEIILGVKDNGKITGVSSNKINNMKNDFINVMNSGSKINPAIHLDIKDIEIEGKTILYISVFQSSQVHRCNGKTFIRQNESDFDISNNNNAISKLYLTKDSSYSENRIFPAVRYEQLREDLIERGRKLALIQNSNHPWKEMDNLTILKRSSLYIEDPRTGEKGYTLAAILLFGTDELIASALPAYRIDVLKRVNNITRYDDRLDLRTTNLLESYDKILEFIAKHLPNPFYLEGSQRINLRENIFRELVANIIVHKEYANAEPTRIIIQRNLIHTENSNKPYINGIINLDNLVTHPKNPNITRFFKEIGIVEELGSGIEKIIHYCKEYTGNEPIIRDENMFTFELKHNLFSISLQENEVTEKKVIQSSDTVKGKVIQSSDTVKEKVIQSKNQKLTIEFCTIPRTSAEIKDYLGLKSKNNILQRVINPLLEQGILIRTIPDKINSSKQKYVVKNTEISDN
ncbi:MAG: putative DNA binding domain-containing protein [Candidatus Gastranaerophilales bacterium]|nr:putative DNA binding domain-containing protein [Candidatus Gastranaerophilales bacterium]